MLLAVMLLAGACTREPAVQDGSGEYIPVRLGISLPVSSGTRGNVEGTEDAISSIWLLCFNQLNSCLDCVEATLTPAGAGSGTLSATIPGATRTIHFIANRNLSGFSQMGEQELAVLTSSALVSSASDHVAYWGYFHGATIADVRSFVDRQPTPNTVYLLRDRARLMVESISPSAGISSVEWTVSNGLTKGYIAPYPFENYYRESGGLYYGNTGVTPYDAADASRGTAAAGDFISSGNALYLFEDMNSSQEPVRVVLKVTYTDTQERYHNLALMDADYVNLPVVRSHTYKYNILSLPKELGYSNLADALAGDVFSNNYFISVDPGVSSVTDGTYSLEINGGTSVLYRTGGSHSIPFTYLQNGAPEAGRSAGDFRVQWLTHDGNITNLSAEPNPSLAYNPDGSGNVMLTLNPVGSDLRQGRLLLQDTRHGLSRYIDVYAVDQFRFESGPDLTKVALKSHNGHDVYSLSFTIPEQFPDYLYPLDIAFATRTLSPYSDASADAAAGSFSVEVSETDALPAGSSDPSDWNYRPRDWDYWYVYSVDGSAARNVTLYFEDVTGSYGVSPTSVGLFLDMPLFNGISAYSLTK